MLKHGINFKFFFMPSPFLQFGYLESYIKRCMFFLINDTEYSFFWMSTTLIRVSSHASYVGQKYFILKANVNVSCSQ